MAQITLKGSCLCGAVHYAVTGEPQAFYHCHCARCRKSSGTGHATNLRVANGKLVFTQGESLVKQYKVPEAESFARQFCSVCGSVVARFVPQRNAVTVPAGSLDSTLTLKPQARIFWDSRADWSCDGDALPRYAEYPT